MIESRQRRILIVEDDTAVRRLLVRHFVRNGFDVAEAGDAATAQRSFPDHTPRFDLVVTDIHLPGESGVALARFIHEQVPEQPVVFVTGDTDEATARRALEQGAAGYLLKPFQLFELDALVAGITRGRDLTTAGCVTMLPSEDEPLTGERVDESWSVATFGAAALRAEPPRPVVLLMEASPRRPRPRYRRVQAVAATALVAAAFLIGVGLAGNGEPVVETAPSSITLEQARSTILPLIIQ
ncbi:MAG: response regulator [Gemmatimonadota bacterium]